MKSVERLFTGHRRIFAALVPILLSLAFLVQPPLIWQIIALGPLVALLGLPHGALDKEVASALFPLVRPFHHIIFVVVYMVLALAVVALWVLQPSMALGAFLIYSALHFADDWRQDLGPWKSLPLGVSVIALPALVFQSDVAMLFGLLSSQPTGNQFADLLHTIAIIAICVSVLCLALNVRRSTWVVVEYALLVTTALITPPLIYFVIYFCGLHSPRHFLLTAEQLGLTPVEGLRAAAPIIGATLLFAAFGTAAVYAFAETLEAATLQVVFIGLAALTVPHMILTAMFRSAHN